MQRLLSNQPSEKGDQVLWKDNIGHQLMHRSTSTNRNIIRVTLSMVQCELSCVNGNGVPVHLHHFLTPS